MTTAEKAYNLIGRHNKTWLCNQIDMDYKTLMVRLKSNQWKPGEIMLINQLHHEKISNSINR